MISTTNFIGSDGVDLGSKLLDKEYFNSVYLNIANQYITPELWVWGQNTNTGELGTNDVIQRCTAVTTFAGGANWKQISFGNGHAAAIKTDGTLWVWGFAQNGRLGILNVPETIKSTPVTTFSGGNNWKQVSAGSNHTAAIKTDGTLWVWGAGGNGQLGTNNGFTVYTPVTTFAGGNNWKQVSCANARTGAIKTDGTLWVWGNNNNGELGINESNSRSTPVTTFAGGTNWKQVSLGYTHSSAIKTDGTLWVWGQNTGFGCLGINSVLLERLTPVTTFIGGNDWKLVTCGLRISTAIKTDGTLWTWGQNNYGQLGDNTTINRCTPVTTFAGGNNWKQVSTNYSSNIAAIKTDGTLWTWGQNTYKELLTFDSISRHTPVTTIVGGNNWQSISNGNGFMMAIRSFDD